MAYRLWASKLRHNRQSAEPNQEVEVLQRKARRLSLQSDQLRNRRRTSARLSLDAKVLLQQRSEVRLDSPSVGNVASPAAVVA